MEQKRFRTTEIEQGLMRFEVVQKAKVKIEFVPEYGQSINPISRLIQIQQAKKEKEPVYTLIAEKGMPRRREFVMQVIMYSSSYYAFYSSRIFVWCVKSSVSQP